MTFTSVASRFAAFVPSRSRPTHQRTRLGSASWMIAPSAMRPVTASAFGPYPATHTGRSKDDAQVHPALRQDLEDRKGAGGHRRLARRRVRDARAEPELRAVLCHEREKDV